MEISWKFQCIAPLNALNGVFVPTVSQGFCAFIRLKLTVAFARATRRIQREVVSTPPLHLPRYWTESCDVSKSTQPAYYFATQIRVFSSACSDCAYIA